MSAFEERDYPMCKRFICNICGYETLTRQGQWDHYEKKHSKEELHKEQEETYRKMVGI